MEFFYVNEQNEYLWQYYENHIKITQSCHLVVQKYECVLWMEMIWTVCSWEDVPPALVLCWDMMWEGLIKAGCMEKMDWLKHNLKRMDFL